MPRKLRYSLTALIAIALAAAFAGSSAQAQSKNTTGTNMRPWTTTHGSNRPVGRNDGYMQQYHGAASHYQPTEQYGAQVGWGERSQTKGLATKKGSQPAKVRATPAVQLNKYAN